MSFSAIINPVTLRGPVMARHRAGVGQALYEYALSVVIGLLAGSLMDYTLPRADHLP